MNFLRRRRCGSLLCLASMAFIAITNLGTYMYLVDRYQPVPEEILIRLEQDSVDADVHVAPVPTNLSHLASPEAQQVDRISRIEMQTVINPKARVGSQWDLLSKFNQRMIYNRVPKGGSMVFSRVMSALGARYNHDFFGIIDDKHAMGRISRQAQAEIVQHVNSLNHAKPTLYIRHMYFINFQEFGPPNPMYINIVREPLERMVSHYYYFLNGIKSGNIEKSRLRWQGHNYTFQECLDLDRTPFTKYYWPNPELWNDELLYFCGNDEVCGGLNETTLAIAKSNVEKHYSVVGIHEDLPSLFDVLDVVAPSIFRNTSAVYAEVSEVARGQLATAQKIPPSPETAAFLKEKAALEYEFYDWIKQRFYAQKARLVG